MGHRGEKKDSPSKNACRVSHTNGTVGGGHYNNRAQMVNSTISYKFQTLSLPSTDLIHRCVRTSPNDHQGLIITHAFTAPLHSLLSCTIILPSSFMECSFHTDISIQFVVFLSTSHVWDRTLWGRGSR